MQTPFFYEGDMGELHINDVWGKGRAHWKRLTESNHIIPMNAFTGYDDEVTILVSAVPGQNGNMNVVAIYISPDNPQKLIRFTGTWKNPADASQYWLNLLNEKILEWVRDPLL